MSNNTQPGGGYIFIPTNGEIEVIQPKAGQEFSEICANAVGCYLLDLVAYLYRNTKTTPSEQLEFWHKDRAHQDSDLNRVASAMLVRLDPSVAKASFGGIWGNVLLSSGAGTTPGQPLSAAEVEHFKALSAEVAREVDQLTN